MRAETKWPIILFSIGVFMAALDNGIITSSLTTLIHSFSVSPTWGAWTITIYTLGLSISVPIAGKLSDRYGRRSLFMAEIALFGVGSLLVALSPSFAFFLIARFIQALGGGGIFIIASSYVLNTVPMEKQGRALGMLGGMNGIAAILGPNLGALILDLTGSWHWLFLINVPIAAILLAAGWKTIHERQTLTTSRLDMGGIALLATATVLLMLAFTKLDGVDLAGSLLSGSFLGLAAAGLLVFVALYLQERRVMRRGEEPVLPLDLLRRPTFRMTLLLGFFSGAILASVIFIPGYVEQYLNVDSSVSGYWFTPLAIASGIGAAGGGSLVDRKGPIFALLFASAIAIVGFALFPLWVETTWQMVVASCLVGLGFGTMLGAPINVLVSEHAGTDKGIALAANSLFRQMGMTLAPTIYAGFLARSFSQLGGQGMPADIGAMDATSMKEALSQMPAEQANKLAAILHEVVGKGYDGLFTSSMIVSCAMLAAVLVLGIMRARRKSGSAA